MKSLTLVLLAMLFGLLAGKASAYSTNEFQRCDTRTIEHAPVPGFGARFGQRKVYVETGCGYRAKKGVRKKLRRTKAVVHRKVRRKVVRHRRIYRDVGAIAGGCREGGIVRRRGPLGVVVVRQREVCDSIAPLSGRYAGPNSVRVPPVFVRTY